MVLAYNPIAYTMADTSGIIYQRRIARRSVWLFLLSCLFVAFSMQAQTYRGTYPTAQISNGILKANIYLPNADTGFYRGRRFDWAGVIGGLEYNGHEYFGPFFEKFDPAISDVMIGDPIEAGIASAASGPVEEFVSGPDGTVVGYDEAKPGEAFCKIGVGALRKLDNSLYSSYVNYPILDGGKRTQTQGSDWIEFAQSLECEGYSFIYKKTIRFGKNEPVMTIEHSLKNSGKKPIDTQVYDHNFLTIDHQRTGPAVSIQFPFAAKPTMTLDKLAEIRGKLLVFPKEFKGAGTFYAEFKGFGSTARDYEMTVENHETGAGVVIRGDQPLVHVGVWAVRSVVAPESYIEIRVPAGQEFEWTYTYRFFTRETAK